MLVLWGLSGWARWFLLIGLFEGPDPLQRWTGVESGVLRWPSRSAWRGVRRALAHPAFGSGYVGLGLGPAGGLSLLCLRGLAAHGVHLRRHVRLLPAAGQRRLMLALVRHDLHLRGGRAGAPARPVGVLASRVFLLALCWWVFIKQLDIRVNVWPQF
jgi:hypothetical protein